MSMLRNPSTKYAPFPQVPLTDRQWPARTITAPPRWLSTDLRDGNQAIVDPMDAHKKNRFFDLLVEVGVKEIEVGFPSAGATEFDFISGLVQSGRVPDDVLVQVLTQSREDLIRTSFASLAGARAAIVHLYNAVSPAWREVVFGMTRDQVRDIAVQGAKVMRDEAGKQPNTDWHFQYSPETFSTAELDFSLEVCEAVMDVLAPTPEHPIILNLPATVEAATPNIYADQVEYFIRNLPNRDSAVISLHTHNDRGTGIAATELGLMAGADRVEGTLFGNGERTGNVDIVTLALNMYTQGVDPELDCSDITRMKEVYEYSNQMKIPERHPYVGELVYTAFSGSHQDAINKGMKAKAKANKEFWEVPYLPIDPQDVGRTYEAIIRINSQSGKGGIAYIMQADYGLNLPRNLQIEFSKDIQAVTDAEGKELSSKRIHERFIDRYVDQPGARLKFLDHHTYPDTSAKGRRIVEATITDGGREVTITGSGTGPIDGFVDALSRHIGIPMTVLDYSEHSMQRGSNAAAISYMEVEHPDGKLFGAGINTNIVAASLEAIVSAANRILAMR